MISKPITISFIALLLINMSQAHGRLVDPVARSSAWRKDHTKFPSYYDDNSMNCGGIGMQIMNGGKCGICGEEKRVTETRDFRYMRKGIFQLKEEIALEKKTK